MDSTWHIIQREHIQVLQLGDLLSEHTNKAVLQEVDTHIAEGYVDYVIDMGAVNYMNSIGLNLLIIMQERTRKSGGKLVLANVSSTVVRLLKMTKLYPLFELKDSVDAAFAAFPAQKN
jgi:anti-anti-sigma factor